MPLKHDAPLGRGAGTVMSVAFAGYLQSHPNWATEHPTVAEWLYVSALVSAVYLFVSFILRWEWGKWFFGIHATKEMENTISVNPGPSPSSKIFSEEQWNQFLNSITDITENAKNSFAQVVLLNHFHAEAVHIEYVLTTVWHHWDNAGEKLIYPIGKKNEWKEWSIDKCLPLVDELRDFRVVFSLHIGWLHLDFPGFSSKLTTSGYPSEDEYQVVLANIRAHGQALKELANSIKKSETFMESLHEKD